MPVFTIRILKLSKINPFLYLQADENLEPIYNFPASPRVAASVYRKALEQAQQQIRTLVVASVRMAASTTFRGLVFEQHGHAAVQAGLKMRARKLERPLAEEGAEAGGGADEDNGEEAEEESLISHHVLPPAEMEVSKSNVKLVDSDVDQVEYVKGGEHRWDHPELDVGGLMENLKEGVYLQPTKSNNPTWDSTICKPSRIDILQFTISGSHGVVAHPIKKLLERLDPGRTIEPVRFIFVVPSEPQHLYWNFKWQPWKKIRSKSSASLKDGELSEQKEDNLLTRVPEQVQRVEQWVMQLPLEPQAPSKNDGHSL
jgi:hypothetical protein